MNVMNSAEEYVCVNSKLGHSNLSNEEWKNMQTLADDRTIVIKRDRQSVLRCSLGP